MSVIGYRTIGDIESVETMTTQYELHSGHVMWPLFFVPSLFQLPPLESARCVGAQKSAAHGTETRSLEDNRLSDGWFVIIKNAALRTMESLRRCPAEALCQ